MENSVDFINENFENKYFPYTPYISQKIFINNLFNLLKEEKKVGIFESPTGTGKSLCLLSGIFKFLEYQQNNDNFKNDNISNKDLKINENINNIQEDDWLSGFGKKSNLNNLLQIKNSTNIKKKFSEKFSNKQNLNLNLSHNISNKVSASYTITDIECKDETDNLIDVDETRLSSIKIDYKPDFQNILDSNKNIEEKTRIQVFYITRTHSQISQVFQEIKKIFNNFIQKFKKDLFKFKISVLGSRKNLCINKLVNQKSFSINKVNNLCLDLISGKKNTQKIARCEFNNQETLELLVNESSENILDIEDLFKLGNDLNACPYLSSKQNISNADLLILPYNSIIDIKVRKSLNIDLKNKILIFDEAHNIVDNILKCYSHELTFDTLIIYFISLNKYIEKFSSRLKPFNVMMIKQLIVFLKKLIKFFLDLNIESNCKENENKKLNSKVIKLSELFINLDILNLNIIKIVNFINISNLNEKLKWTFNSILNEEQANILGLFNKGNLDTEIINDNKEKKSQNKKKNKNKYEVTLDYNKIKTFKENNMPYINDIFSKYLNKKTLHEFNQLKKVKLSDEFYQYFFSSEKFEEITNFLLCLTCIDEDGSIIIDFISDNNDNNYCNQIIGQYEVDKLGKENVFYNRIKFILTNANRHFDKIIKESKCIIMAGGTMKPMEEFNLLFSSLENSQIVKFEGTHVIEKNNILVSNITFNPFDLEYSFNLDNSNIINFNDKLPKEKFKKPLYEICFNYDSFKKNLNGLCKSILDIILLHKNLIFDRCDKLNEKNICYTNSVNEKDLKNFIDEDCSYIKKQKSWGIVAFVTSYEILGHLRKFYEKIKIDLKHDNNPNDKIENIENYYSKIIKKIFFDEIIFEDKSGKIDAFLHHQEKIQKYKKNSILIAVVGGKLSEGINFSDDLARCIILFGMPFQNIKSQEIKLKMDFYDKLYKDNKSSINGNDYYENQCMKSVNQTIGRSIRHKNDFSSIVLVDIRYKNSRIRSKLSKWLLENEILNVDCFDKIVYYEKKLIEFYSGKIL